MNLDFAPLSNIARSTFAALTCASVLAASSIPNQAEAAVTAPAAKLITQVTTPRGETIRFNLKPDGSVGVIGTIRASTSHDSIYSNHKKYATPLELFRAAAPREQAPLALIEANNRYTASLQRAGVQVANPTLKTGHARRARGKFTPLDNPEQWFIDDYCNPASGSSYNVCYTPAWNWAYLNDQSVYYGHSVVYAISPGFQPGGTLDFNVQPVGDWSVSQGQVWWASDYQWSPFGWNNFSFNASVNNAGWFDFEADIDY